MDNVQRDSWVRAMQASFSEFVSRPSEANKKALEKLLTEYHDAVASGKVALYRPHAA